MGSMVLAIQSSHVFDRHSLFSSSVRGTYSVDHPDQIITDYSSPDASPPAAAHF
jgi:hypothetical protein